MYLHERGTLVCQFTLPAYWTLIAFEHSHLDNMKRQRGSTHIMDLVNYDFTLEIP